MDNVESNIGIILTRRKYWWRVIDETNTFAQDKINQMFDDTVSVEIYVLLYPYEALLFNF